MSTIGLFRTAHEEAVFQQRVNDLSRFTTLQLYSKDIDPVYPVLRHIIEKRCLVREEAFWLVTLYLCYYNLSSALTAFDEQPKPKMLPGWCLTLPTGVERRGLRDRSCMREHLESYLNFTENAGYAWAMEGMGADRIANFHTFWERSQLIDYNGRWAAFKWTELLMSVLDIPFSFPDMRLEQCSGPREGLEWLYDAGPVPVLNQYANDLQYELKIRGHNLPWEQLETMLCDFNSMRKGKYYAGRDIDEMQDQILTAEAKGHLHEPQASELFKARSAVIPHAYLGEWSGWRGVQAARKTIYVQYGIVASRP